MQGIGLRQAEMADLEKTWALYSSAVDHLARSGIDQWDALYPDAGTIREDIACGSMYLLEDKDALLSAVVLSAHQEAEYAAIAWLYDGGTVLTVHRLCVSPARQGLGIGKLTMQLLEELARQKGCEALRLDAFCLNPAANSLYEGLGYRKAGSVIFRKGIFYCYEKVVLP